jgi:hypothetical protein
VVAIDGVLHHWRVDDQGLPDHPEVRLQLDIESLMEGEIEPDGACWATERDASCGPDLVGRAFEAKEAEGLAYAGRRPRQQTEPSGERPRWGRDPERIALVLSAVEREWRKQPDTRLGQLVVNLLRMNTSILGEDEGKVLFSVADGQLLRWLGPQSEEEENYIREEPRKAREGWRAWEHDLRERQRAKREEK